jgi:hypothetical protein
VHPFLVDHADTNMNLAPFSPIRVRFMLDGNKAADTEVKLILPETNVWGITGATPLRCYIKWTENNKLYRVEGVSPTATIAGG